MKAYAYRLFRNWQGDVLAIPGRAIAFFGLLLLFFIPLVTQNPYILRVLTFTSIFAIYAASWDLLSGFTGLLTLGHGAFFAIGAYSAALLNLRLGLPPWATIPIGALIAVPAALIIGFPALRVRGTYLILITLCVPIILTGVVLAFSNFTGGELGLSGIARLSTSRLFDYYLVLAVMISCALLMWKLTDAKSKLIRLGIFLHAIREDEITARASGIDTTKYKLLAFCLSGFFAGLAGSLYAHSIRIAGPSTLEVWFSIQPVMWAIFGGTATINGPIVGVYLLYPLAEFLRIIPELRTLIFALVIILLILFMPRGLTVRVREEIERQCPRCKVINVITRRSCRACYSPLHLDEGESKNG
jgi:branched-chain amino acid transport system permease protein